MTVQRANCGSESSQLRPTQSFHKLRRAARDPAADSRHPQQHGRMPPQGLFAGAHLPATMCAAHATIDCRSPVRPGAQPRHSSGELRLLEFRGSGRHQELAINPDTYRSSLSLTSNLPRSCDFKTRAWQSVFKQSRGDCVQNLSGDRFVLPICFRDEARASILGS